MSTGVMVSRGHVAGRAGCRSREAPAASCKAVSAHPRRCPALPEAHILVDCLHHSIARRWQSSARGSQNPAESLRSHDPSCCRSWPSAACCGSCAAAIAACWRTRVRWVACLSRSACWGQLLGVWAPLWVAASQSLSYASACLSSCFACLRWQQHKGGLQLPWEARQTHTSRPQVLAPA